MSESFLAYSLSVITSRAIPDVKDGLKPVQRRILYSMAGLGMRPDQPHRKCAGVVGDTMGRYHPHGHGDGAIYDALTRMGQDSLRTSRSFDPHCNFGASTTPAAYRYTSVDSAASAMAMFGGIDEDTVSSALSTFRGEREEPVLPPRSAPNLLVNGTTRHCGGYGDHMAAPQLAKRSRSNPSS
ncbi:UNVERIFIED_CONTAM: hypothetical protein GTU68_005632 [Idotea baltica]|nr:hypothetical protein [Idotea baltica]